ncbi:MarR family transcriptional regulator [Micromonospora sp. KC207]|uniref:MarR family winged helix-turn-helix transcriptional regulator n=1 Tax=Micromonospora sp. KC207 TaxID=2530377 RepID=UPI00104CC2FA|nr:MarR family transcriptional regulator [Micromonospora sp. KC207]TDC59519.1 MarR family transcriptional regulator [Micromonospora sp. KC207]
MDLIGLRDVPLGRLLVTAGHVVGQRWNRYLAEEHGLTQAGMVTLMTLARHGELPHRAVAEACFIRPATLTGIVDTLERDGLVERQRDDVDRRSVRLVLTPAGRERVAALTNVMQSGRPMTSVDADPAKAAVIRQFLLEVIGSGEEPRVTALDARPEAPAC